MRYNGFILRYHKGSEQKMGLSQDGPQARHQVEYVNRAEGDSLFPNCQETLDSLVR